MAKAADVGRAARDLRLVVAVHAVSTYGSYRRIRLMIGADVLADSGARRRRACPGDPGLPDPVDDILVRVAG
ncbi:MULTISPECIES: hypothetical protein [unclassified Micromonospora]|uniref:hypothetical protein n=1 Tax=unclassified Micromonospora TaxID=2617518 RepID=UPI0036297092